MNALAIAAPILPGKVDDWKDFSKNLHEGPQNEAFVAFTNFRIS